MCNGVAAPICILLPPSVPICIRNPRSFAETTLRWPPRAGPECAGDDGKVAGGKVTCVAVQLSSDVIDGSAGGFQCGGSAEEGLTLNSHPLPLRMDRHGIPTFRAWIRAPPPRLRARAGPKTGG